MLFAGAVGTFLPHMDRPFPGCFALPRFGMMPRRELLGRTLHQAAGHPVEDLDDHGPWTLLLGGINVAVTLGKLEHHRLVDLQLRKDLIADIDRVEIDILAALVSDESKSSVGSDIFDRAVEHKNVV